MIIGNHYSDNKIYRGIKHYDKMPLMSEDIHEYSDTIHMKNAYIMNNLLGYGTLNTPSLYYDDSGIRLSEPSVIMIDGDVALIQSDDNTPIVSKSEINTKGFTEGIIAVLGWYQHISISTTMRNYGGVLNSEIANDLANNSMNKQVSSRYQFRWMPLVLSGDYLDSNECHLTMSDRDENGDELSTSTTMNSKGRMNNVFIFPAPTKSSLDYILSDMYLIPIARYTYDSKSDTITSTYTLDKVRAGYPFLVSEEEPSGILPNGTTWYNPTTREFMTYVAESGGFVAIAPKMSFLHYSNSYVIKAEDITNPNFSVPIEAPDFNTSSDILQVIYEGLVLQETEQYEISGNSVVLNFDLSVGDHVYIRVTRMVNSLREGLISATMSNSRMIAAEDTSAYKFGVENGIAFIEEV